MTSAPRKMRRVQLAVPGSSDKMLGKAAASQADHVFLDLEDAVAPIAKKPAREQIVRALNTLDWGDKIRCVRINDLRTRWAYEDVIEVVRGAGPNIDTIMLPKAQAPRDIHFLETLLSQLEMDLGLSNRIGIEALIEEVHGMMNVDAIAACSDRLESLIFGVGDYSASQMMDSRSVGGSTGYPGDIWHYGRYKMIIAARANGLDPIDGPFADFKDGDAYREECKRGLILGAAGKWAIHPAQIPIALEVYTPAEDDVAHARKMIAAYEDAEAKGLGAIQIDGEMVDAASVRILTNTLKRAGLA
jgi:citrate lyase subunit beta / citryl-CoA lyase